MKLKLLFLIPAAIAFLFLGGCNGPVEIDSYEGNISEVVDGCTIKVDGEIAVKINGLSDNTFTKEHLQHYVGQAVTLKTDSEALTTTAEYGGEIEAYVTIVSTGEDLGYELLKMAGERAFNPLTCHDRYEEYQKVVKRSHEPLTSELLCSRMTASSMLVYAKDHSSQWLGTAFFIGNDGLALTNNHVLNHNADAVVYISNSNGEIDTEQPFKIKRIVYTDKEYDYTIFYVDLDPTALKRIVYLPLANDEKCFVRGAEIASIGNPAPGGNLLTMSFASGTISALRPEAGKIQMDVAITCGFSGGPTANKSGEAVGISVSGFTNNDANLNFAVDIRVVRQKLDELNLPYAGK